MNSIKTFPLLYSTAILASSISIAHAQGDDAVAEMARKAQDPLGNVKAIIRRVLLL